jgi:vancomycin resistance protein VanJ
MPTPTRTPPWQRPQRTPRKLVPTIIACAAHAYLMGLAALTVSLWTLADKWWPATVLLFSPRWVLALPLLLLLPLAVAAHRRSLITLGAAALLLIWPLLGLRIPLHRAATDGSTSFLRVLTCNVHRRQLNAAEFKTLLDDVRPDVVALQDWTSFHQSELFAPGMWYFQRNGELFLASRYPILTAQPIGLEEPPRPAFNARLGAAAYYRLQTPLGLVGLINLHLASPHEALDALAHLEPASLDRLEYNTRCRALESQTVTRFVSQLYEPVMIVGDFNTPSESAVYREFWNQFTDAFLNRGFGFGSTHVSTLSSVRIDHILVGAGWDTRECWIAHATGSPHRPLIADLQRSPASGDVFTNAEP